MGKQLTTKSCQLFSQKGSSVDVRLGSKYASSVNDQIMKRNRSGPLEKEDILKKRTQGIGPMPRFTVLVKNTFMTNQRLLVSNMTIAFSLKQFFFNKVFPKSGIFSPKVKGF